MTRSRSQLVAMPARNQSGIAHGGSTSAFSPGEPEQALFRFDIGRSLKKHRGLAMAIAVAGVVLAGLYAFRYWSNYTAETLVYIQPTPAGGPGGAVMHWPYNYDPGTYDSYIQQQILSMTRPDVLKNALSKIGGFQQSGESEQDAAERLGHSVEVARQSNSYQVSIKAHAGKAQMAADIANALAAAYIESTSHEQRAGDAERLAILREESDRVKKELADDRAEQALLNAQLGVAGIGAAVPQHYDDDIGRIHDQLVKARADRDEAEARLAALSSGNAAGLGAQADQLASADAGLTALKAALDQRRAALVQQTSNLTPSHPQYKQAQAELAQIDASIENATRQLQGQAAGRIQEQLRTDLARTAGVEARLNGELAQMTRAAAGATPKLQRANDLATDIARLQARYVQLDEQIQNQMIEDAAPGTAHVNTAAVPPGHPSVNGVIRNALILLLGFLMIALSAAVAANKMDQRLYVAADVEQVLGFPPLAQLPDFGQVSAEVAEEHLLRLSSAIEHALKQGNLNSCLFTGTGPGVGVTTIATRVRSLMEGMSCPAVLVDAAGARPAIWPASSTIDPAELRGTRPLVLVQKLTEEARMHNGTLVMTDAAPLSLSAETEYLARNADCVIVVMESGTTTRAQLRTVAAALQRLDVSAVGFVVNGISMANADAAFRDSVRAVEGHLRLQSRAAEPEPRLRRVEAQPAAAARAPAREVEPALPVSQPAVAVTMPPSVPVASPVAMAESSTPPPAPPQELLWSYAPIEPAAKPPEFVQQAAAPVTPPPLSAPAPRSDSDLPWWLADPTLKAQPPAEPVYAQPAPATQVARLQEPTPDPRESRLSGLRSIFGNRKAEAPPIGGPAPEPMSFAAPAAEPAPWSFAAAAAEPVPAPFAASVPEPPPMPAVEPAVADHGAVFVPVAEQETLFMPQPAAESPDQVVPIDRGTREVTAVPEFLPPRKTRNIYFDDDGTTRRERRDTWDDLDVLPSWRGQYRRK